MASVPSNPETDLKKNSCEFLALPFRNRVFKLFTLTYVQFQAFYVKRVSPARVRMFQSRCTRPAMAFYVKRVSPAEHRKHRKNLHRQYPFPERYTSFLFFNKPKA
jgi:hypothetical protein